MFTTTNNEVSKIVARLSETPEGQQKLHVSEHLGEVIKVCADYLRANQTVMAQSQAGKILNAIKNPEDRRAIEQELDLYFQAITNNPKQKCSFTPTPNLKSETAPKNDEGLVEAYRQVLYNQGIEISQQLFRLAKDKIPNFRDELLENKMDILAAALVKFEQQLRALGVDKSKSLSDRITVLTAIDEEKKWFSEITKKEFAKLNEPEKNTKQYEELLRTLSPVPKDDKQKNEIENRKAKLLDLNKKFVNEVFNPDNEKTLGKNRNWLTSFVKTVLAVGSFGIAYGLAGIYARLFNTTGLYGTASEQMVINVKTHAARGLKPNKRKS